MACNKPDFCHHQSALGFLSNRLQSRWKKRKPGILKTLSSRSQLGNMLRKTSRVFQGLRILLKVFLLAEMFGLRTPFSPFDDAPTSLGTY